MSCWPPNPSGPQARSLVDCQWWHHLPGFHRHTVPTTRCQTHSDTKLWPCVAASWCVKHVAVKAMTRGHDDRTHAISASKLWGLTCHRLLVNSAGCENVMACARPPKSCSGSLDTTASCRGSMAVHAVQPDPIQTSCVHHQSMHPTTLHKLLWRQSH
jgi:hypothetical protein